MDVASRDGNSCYCIETGSKDKTIALSTLSSIQKGNISHGPIWKSNQCDKNTSVAINNTNANMILSASDIIATYDIRTQEVIREINNAHFWIPDSVMWNPDQQNAFMTSK